jgi:hypothetical protein
MKIGRLIKCLHRNYADVSDVSPDKEIITRELISNSSDALEKIRNQCPHQPFDQDESGGVDVGVKFSEMLAACLEEVCARTKAHQNLSAALVMRCGALMANQPSSAPPPQVEELFQRIVQFLQIRPSCACRSRS